MPYRRTVLSRVRLPSFATYAQVSPQGIEPCSRACDAHALAIVLRSHGELVGGSGLQSVCDIQTGQA